MPIPMLRKPRLRASRRRRFRSRAPFRPRRRAGRATAGAFRGPGVASGRFRRHRSYAAAKSDAQVKSDGKSEPAPLTNGVIQTQPIAVIPGSSEPMKPVRVKTVQIKAGQVKLASAGSAQPATPVTNTIRHAWKCRKRRARSWPRPRPANLIPAGPTCRRSRRTTAPEMAFSACCRHRASPPALPPQAMAYADPAARSQPQPQTIQQNGAIKPEDDPHRMDHSGRRAGERKRSAAAHRSRAQLRPMACSTRLIRSPNRWSPRATESCSGPVSPASIAIRPKRHAGR